MKKMLLFTVVLAVVALICAPATSLASPSTSGMPENPLAAAAKQTAELSTRGKIVYLEKWRPTYSAFMTNGKGKGYKTYRHYPYTGATVVYKARIVGSKLRIWGTMTRHYSSTNYTKKITMKGTRFKLTSKTKYYRHFGNNAYCEKFTKAKLKKYLTSKPKSQGGDISMRISNGKVSALVAQ